MLLQPINIVIHIKGNNKSKIMLFFTELTTSYMYNLLYLKIACNIILHKKYKYILTKMLSKEF
jgi:hypothetical protein